MYIQGTQTYYTASGNQHARKANFLILLSRDGTKEIRGIVRKVALGQWGHFMMGYARVFGKSLLCDGCYGSLGLPIYLDSPYKKDKYPIEWLNRVWDSAIPLPQELYDAWNNGGGWNSAGSEAEQMRQWAIKTFINKE